MNDELELLIKQTTASLRASGAQEVYLFGSAANVTMREDSDIDLAVSGLPPERFFRAMGEAGDILGRPTDLVDLDVPGLFTDYLKRKGKLHRVA